MKNLSQLIHVMSMFHFAGMVLPRGNGWTVIGKGGELLQVVEDGQDLTEQLGGSHPFNGEPLAKQQRLFKLNDKGQIVKCEAYAERVEVAKLLLDKNGVAKTVKALRKEGLEFMSKDEKRDVDLVLKPESVEKLKAPKAQPQA